MSQEASNFRRLSLLSTGIAMLAILVLMAGERWYSAVNEAAEDVVELSSILSANVGAALAFNDSEAGAELLSALHNSSYLRQAALYRNDGSVLASFHKADEPAGLPEAPAPLNKASRQLTLRGWRVTVPISVNDRPVGTLVIWSSLGHASYELKEFVAVFIMIAGVALFLAYASSRGMRRRMLDSQIELRDSQTMIRQLSVHRDKLVEDEHKRIALEIHDDLGQVLTAAMLSLKRVGRRLRDGESVTAEQIDDVESLVRNAFRSIKGIAAKLRPPVLNIGLAAALEWLAESMLAQDGIKFRLDLPEHLPPLADHCSITLFRIAQESLSNVVRHARANHASIGLHLDTRQLVLSIEDDGVGFDEAPHDGMPHFGLLGMRERARSLQGAVHIDSATGQGTRITVSIPIGMAIAEREVS